MSHLRLIVAFLFLLASAAPVSAGLLSPADQQSYRDAFAAARTANWNAARGAADRAAERLPAKVLRWLELTRNQGGRTASFAEIVDFADRNPDWPLPALLRQRAEEASADVPDAVLLPYFQKNRPATPDGKLRFADMLAASGQRDAALALVRELWVSPEIGPDTEAAILARYADGLRPQDHLARLDRLLWDGQESAARRQMVQVPEERRRLAEARLAFAHARPDADALAAQLPGTLRDDPGLRFEEARRNRKQNRLDEAASILLAAPHDPAGHVGAWWSERNALARRLLDEGGGAKDRLAYDVASRHFIAEPGDGTGSGKAAANTAIEFADAEFLAGWIALRRLGAPAAAAAHFARLHAAVGMPISIARAAYWAGRAAEAQGNAENGRRWYAAAAAQGTTFYGQLAAAKLGTAAAPLFPALPRPDETARSAFDRKELVRAVRMLAELGEGETAKPFLLRLSLAAKTPEEQALVIALADSAGRPDMAVSAARRATAAEGVPPLEAGYPVLPVVRKGLAEAPLVLAVTRQESVFDPGAVSRSDARGLMQLKPSTAKDVAKMLSMPFSAERLTADPAYNLTLGHAYLDKMLDGFSGSYVLSVAAYNAGPNRVRQWLATYGDPRDAGVDTIDWIETIPFSETRNYVQRVLENLQVYRLRLGDRANAFTLAQDLRR
jgi:soluble lytic murein transglycosylase